MSDPALIHEAIIEAAARALQKHWLEFVGDSDLPIDGWLPQAASILAAVTPLIRAAALEEAAQVAEECDLGGHTAEDDLTREIAAAIRALKPASPSPSADSA